MGSPGHIREVVYGLNTTEKIFISMLMTTVQLTGEASYESYTKWHTSTLNTDISLSGEFPKHLSDPIRKHIVIDHGNNRTPDSKLKLD